MIDKDELKIIYAEHLAAYEKTDVRSLENERTIRCISSEIKTLRYLAVAEIILSNDLKAFKERIHRVIQLNLALFEGYDRGLPIEARFVSMGQFHYGLDALASNDLDLARKYYGVIGGRELAESKIDNEFTTALGYAVKELILVGNCSPGKLEKLTTQLKQPSFAGYAKLIAGISSRDKALSEAGIKEAIKGHKVLARPGGMYHLTPDEFICLWAVGLINLASFFGLKISIPDSELLPKALLMAQD